MKQLVVISGKGGTGKTIICAAIATLAQNKVMADCDVDASNLHLLLCPEVQETQSFSGGEKALVDHKKCTRCQECIDVCRFDAIEEKDGADISIDPISCEGCGVCRHVCPADAIQMGKALSGEWYVSKTRYGPFVHARLGIGEENSGKLVAEVRKKAKEIAEQENMDFIVIDGPPGTGCPVISSLTGTDLALVVTEPSLAGIHDMERVVRVASHFRTRTACCINKFDINLENSSRIEIWCQKNGIPLLGKIPFDAKVIESMVQRIPVTEYSHRSSSQEIKKMWDKLHPLLVGKEKAY